MAKPPEKDKEPSPVEIAIAAVLSVIVGAVGAAVFLVLQPVEKVSELPEPEDRALARLYSVEGKAGGASHDTWEGKKANLEAGRNGELTLVEEELNRWAAKELKAAEAEDGEEAGFLAVEPGAPGFRIADDLLTVKVPLTWTAFGASRTFDAQTSGRFVQQGGGPAFDFDRFYLGSCPIPGFLANRLMADVIASYGVSDGLRNGWASLQSVEVDGDSLKLLIP